MELPMWFDCVSRIWSVGNLIYSPVYWNRDIDMGHNKWQVKMQAMKRTYRAPHGTAARHLRFT